MNVQPRNWWAVGKLRRHKHSATFHIRRLVSGRMLARAERREDETIRRVETLMIETRPSDYARRRVSDTQAARDAQMLKPYQVGAP